jgi:hypothetical protein
VGLSDRAGIHAFAAFAFVVLVAMGVAVATGNAAAPRQVWYWSPDKMDAAIQSAKLRFDTHTTITGFTCVGYGPSTYSDNDVKLFNRFRCDIGAMWQPYGPYIIPTRPSSSQPQFKKYHVTTRATSRFTFVLTSRITGEVG